MPLKDYYLLLNVKPGADIISIKRAFRRLAHTYHPDKSGGNKLNHDYYTELQEAYSTLTDPEKREAYHYQRWLEKATGNELDDALSAVEILKLFLQVEKNISQSNQFNIDTYRMGRQLISLFSTTRLRIIAGEQNPELVSSVNKIALSLAGIINVSDINLLADHLKKHLPDWTVYEKDWKELVRKKEYKNKINNLRMPIALAVAVLLCLLFYILLQ
jgi:hypothetical protein